MWEGWEVFQGGFRKLCPSTISPDLRGVSRQDAGSRIQILRARGAPWTEPLRRCFIQPEGWKIPSGSKPPISGASPTPKPGVLGNCPNLVEDKAVFCCPQSGVCPLPLVPVCSKLLVFAPVSPRVPSCPACWEGPAAPREKQAGRNRRKWCPVSNATSLRVPMAWCRSLGGVAGLGGSSCMQPPPLQSC